MADYLQTKSFKAIDWLICLGLFTLALWLRASNLDHFVTADEHNWIYRSGLFLNAFLQGDWPGTSVWLTPAVTTTWLGSAGVTAYYQLHQTDINQPFLEWLVSFSSTKVNLDILVALRWSMAVFTATMVVVVYILARKLWVLPLALLGTLFLLLDPHLLSVSRIIGHDAPATLFATASLLAFFYARRKLSQRVSESTSERIGGSASRRETYFSNGGTGLLGWFAFSGVMAGLGVLSKAPVLFLVPFVGLIALSNIWQRRGGLKHWILALLIWGGVLWLTFILGWPAAWASPWGQTWAVISNAFLSSAGLEDADIQPFWSVPDLGVFYYLINGAFKLSPFVLFGVIAAFFISWLGFRRKKHSLATLVNSEIFWLLVFAVLFGLFMTLGAKRSPRYILPAFPALAYVAAWGWLKLVPARWQLTEVFLLGSVSLLLVLNYAPYYFSYFNPLLGGPYTAPKLVRIGWGEGLDEVGRWLNNQADATAASIGTRYKTGVDSFYQGQIESPTDEGLDYVTFYIKQSQSGYPTPEVLSYFEHQGALHRVVLNGIDYAQVYKGPAMYPIDTGGHTNLPVAYRPHTIYGPIGEILTVDLLWSADFTKKTPVTLAIASPDKNLQLESTAKIIEQSPGVNVSTHNFNLPPETPRAEYTLFVGDTPLGQIKVRLMNVPPNFEPLDFTAQSVKLAGANKQLQNNKLAIDLAWQARPKVTNDFTVFIQVIDDNGQRVAGVDVAPQPGFTSLDKQEMMITHYDIPLESASPGEYNLLIGLYFFAGDELVNVGAITLDKIIQVE